MFKNIRYLSELTKFNICDDKIIFQCIHSLLLSFTPSSVVTLCELLEGCGSYLYRNKLTHIRCVKYLKMLKELKNKKFLSNRLKLMVENALHRCIPSTTSAMSTIKKRHPYHRFIRHLIFSKLNWKVSIESNTCKLIFALNFSIYLKSIQN